MALGHTYITLGKFHFTFWGLNRYHILRLFRLEKRLNYPQSSFCCTRIHLDNRSAQPPNSVVQWRVKNSSPIQMTDKLASSVKAGEVLVPVSCTFWKILSQCCLSLLNSAFLQAPPVLPQSLSLPCMVVSAHLCFCSGSLYPPVDTNYNKVFSLRCEFSSVSSAQSTGQAQSRCSTHADE